MTRRARSAPACVLLLIGMLSGCEGVPPAGWRMLVDANNAYARGEYAAGERSAGEFLRTFPSSSSAGQAYYVRGLCRLRLRQTEAARADLAAGAAKADRTDLRAQCQAELANLACDEGDVNASLAGYAAAVPYLPARPPTDETLYRYGVCLQQAGRWGDARRIFSRLLDEFGTSRDAAKARCRFEWRHDHFAIECGAYPRVDEANRAADALKAKGLGVVVEYFDLDNRAMWRLLVGEYPTYKAAANDLSRVRVVEPGAIIVP